MIIHGPSYAENAYRRHLRQVVSMAQVTSGSKTHVPSIGEAATPFLPEPESGMFYWWSSNCQAHHDPPSAHSACEWCCCARIPACHQMYKALQTRSNKISHHLQGSQQQAYLPLEAQLRVIDLLAKHINVSAQALIGGSQLLLVLCKTHSIVLHDYWAVSVGTYFHDLIVARAQYRPGSAWHTW